MNRRERIERAMRRRAGASPEVREQLCKMTATWDDWRGTCRNCGHTRRGSLDDLMKPCPKCGHGAPG